MSRRTWSVLACPVRMLRIGIIGEWESRGKPANPGLPGKRPLKRCVCGVCVRLLAMQYG